jgi:hypothetical protein
MPLNSGPDGDKLGVPTCDRAMPCFAFEIKQKGINSLNEVSHFEPYF